MDGNFDLVFLQYLSLFYYSDRSSRPTHTTMVYHIKFNLFSNKKNNTSDQLDDSISTASTIAPSKSLSVINSFLAAFSTDKYYNDPMRTTNHPDVVGFYYDPMSCGGRRQNVVSAGFDCTNTGA